MTTIEGMTPSPVKLFLLGPPRLEQNGQVVEPDTRKATALLAYLMVEGERPSRDFLAAFLWPDFDGPHARAALRRTLSAMKKVIGATAIAASRETIGLNSGQVWCDVADFRQNLQQGDLETAVALYRDDFLAGFSLRDSLSFDDWQLAQTEHLRREFTGALAQLAGRHKEQGAWPAAISCVRRWLQLDPLREEAHRQLMELLAWSGQRAAALQQYRACVGILEAELGVPPLPETTTLYEAIQNDELPPPAAPPQPDFQAAAPHLGRSAVPLLPLVGRAAERAAMARAYGQVEGSSRFLVLIGEAGIGKTRLAEAFLDGMPHTPRLTARCYAGETHLAYAPFAQALREVLRQPEAARRLQTVAPSWLAEATRLLPELAERLPNLPPPPLLDWPGASGRFLEGMGQVIAALLTGDAPGILWLDDGQWADAASLDLLAFLVRRWRERPFFILVCWREGELPADHQLRHLLAETRREERGEQILLARLEETAVAELVQSVGIMAAAADPATFARRLFQETEGLPFLIVSYLQARPTPESIDSVPWGLPATARDLFQSRLLQVGETGRQLLQAAAVIGRAFSFELLLAVSGRSEDEALPGLEALVGQNLLVEQTGQALYDFCHHKLRELLYADMSLARRRLLHRRVAQRLRSLHAILPGELAGQVGHHLQAAGQELEAALFFRQAGDYARTLFAHRDALIHYQAALALGHPETAVLHEGCGDLHTRLGEYTAALASYQQAAAVSTGSYLPRLEHKLGQVYYRRGDWNLAARHFAQAEAGWTSMDAATDVAQLYMDWAVCAYRAGEMAQAVRLAQQAQSTAADPLTQAQTANVVGILARKQGDEAAAMAEFERALQLAETHGFLAVQIASLNNLGLQAMAGGSFSSAQELLETALRRCLTYGDRHWEAALRNNLADLLHRSSQEEAAMAQLKQAVTIYAEIGQETGEWQPEIWKLSEWYG